MKINIDPYFKKGLNVPQEPPADAWQYIQQHIHKKAKKRVYPFWLRVSGIAALFIFLTLGGFFVGKFSSQFDNQNSSNQIFKNSDLQNTTTTAASKREKTAIAQSNHFNDKINENKFTSNSNNQISNWNRSHQFNQNLPKRSNFNSNPANSYVDIHYDQEIENKIEIKNNHNPILNFVLPKWNSENLIDPISSIENVSDEPQIAMLESESDKSSKKLKPRKPQFDRFYISGFASPMAFNTFVGNSMLADEMSQYKTENNVTLAYGVKAAYALNPRVKIRTGASVVGFEQITKDVPLSSAVQGQDAAVSTYDEVNNIKYNGNLRVNNSASSNLINNELNNKAGKGDIQQQSQYIEIPLEAEISLFQTNSIGISATGGGSTWVVSKNKIYVHTDEYTDELGKANNLNNVSFSANAGLKFDMNLTDKIKLNLEPNFKYLFNPVNDIKKYNPYTVGVNAGISISIK